MAVAEPPDEELELLELSDEPADVAVDALDDDPRLSVR